MIIYDSKYGTVKKVADKVGNNLSMDVIHINQKPDLKSAHKIIIGCSIHIGKIQKSISKFINLNKDELMKKKLAIFICTLTPIEEAAGIFIDKNFDQDIVKHTKFYFVGGEANYDEMNFINRFIIKKISKKKESFSTLDENIIESINV